MLETFIKQVWNIWMAGGWVMIPLLGLSLMIYALAARLLIYFSRRDFHKLNEDEWMSWVRAPELGRGEVGEIIRYTQDEVRTPDEIHSRFSEVMAARLPSIDRRLSTLGTLIAAAPLLGLLGTVFGMLVTFKALALGGGGAVTDQMAAGISQALFPPEVGLCVALPGLLISHVIKRKRLEYEAFLAHVESCTIQYFKQTFTATPAGDNTRFFTREEVAPSKPATAPKQLTPSTI